MVSTTLWNDDCNHGFSWEKIVFFDKTLHNYAFLFFCRWSPNRGNFSHFSDVKVAFNSTEKENHESISRQRRAVHYWSMGKFLLPVQPTPQVSSSSLSSSSRLITHRMMVTHTTECPRKAHFVLYLSVLPGHMNECRLDGRCFWEYDQSTIFI